MSRTVRYRRVGATEGPPTGAWRLPTVCSFVPGFGGTRLALFRDAIRGRHTAKHYGTGDEIGDGLTSQPLWVNCKVSVFTGRGGWSGVRIRKDSPRAQTSVSLLLACDSLLNQGSPWKR
jgi:hypothetical protein